MTQIFPKVLEKIFTRKLDELYPHAKFEQNPTDSFQNRSHSTHAQEVRFSLRGRGHGTLPEPREKVGECPDHLALEAERHTRRAKVSMFFSIQLPKTIFA